MSTHQRLTDLFGERCDEFNAECATCIVWKLRDDLTAAELRLAEYEVCTDAGREHRLRVAAEARLAKADNLLCDVREQVPALPTVLGVALRAYLDRPDDSAPAVCPACRGDGWTGLGNTCIKCNGTGSTVTADSAPGCQHDLCKLPNTIAVAGDTATCRVCKQEWRGTFPLVPADSAPERKACDCLYPSPAKYVHDFCAQCHGRIADSAPGEKP